MTVYTDNPGVPPKPPPMDNPEATWRRRTYTWLTRLVAIVKAVQTQLQTITTTVTGYGQYQDFTPNFSGHTMTNEVARYSETNEQIHAYYYGEISVVGSAAVLSIDLPVTAAQNDFACGRWILIDDSVPDWYDAAGFIFTSGTKFAQRRVDNAGTPQSTWASSTNTPVTYAVGDVIMIEVIYEKA